MQAIPIRVQKQEEGEVEAEAGRCHHQGWRHIKAQKVEKEDSRCECQWIYLGIELASSNKCTFSFHQQRESRQSTLGKRGQGTSL